jgi:hypothetical protein
MLLLIVGFGYRSYHVRSQSHQQAVHGGQLQPVRLTVQQPGLLPFLLGLGTIESARFDSVRQLVVSGDLSVAGRLQARFAASPGYLPRNGVDLVTARVGAEMATQATGHAVYDPDTRMVSGSFHCVLPSGKQFSCSFPPTPVVLHAQVL